MREQTAVVDTRLAPYFAERMKAAGLATIRQWSLKSGVNYHTTRDALYEGAELGVFKALALAEAIGIGLEDLVNHLPRRR